MERGDGIFTAFKSVCFVSILCSQWQRRDVATSTPTLPMRSSGLNSIHPLRRAKNAKARSFWDVVSLSARHERLLLIFVFLLFMQVISMTTCCKTRSRFMNFKPDVNDHLFLSLSVTQCVSDISLFPRCVIL